jgi:hypothetical protein
MEYYPYFGKYGLDPADQKALAFPGDMATIADLHELERQVSVEYMGEGLLFNHLLKLRAQGAPVSDYMLDHVGGNVERLGRLHMGLVVALQEGFDDRFGAL